MNYMSCSADENDKNYGTQMTNLSTGILQLEQIGLFWKYTVCSSVEIMWLAFYIKFLSGLKQKYGLAVHQTSEPVRTIWL